MRTFCCEHCGHINKVSIVPDEDIDIFVKDDATEIVTEVYTVHSEGLGQGFQTRSSGFEETDAVHDHNTSQPLTVSTTRRCTSLTT